jgi:hypothetical protein
LSSEVLLYPLHYPLSKIYQLAIQMVGMSVEVALGPSNAVMTRLAEMRVFEQSLEKKYVADDAGR